MLTITFDTEAYKTKAIDGSYGSRAQIEGACVKLDATDPAYFSWAIKHGVDPSSGSIITTAYNPDLLERRYNALSAQLDDFIGAKQGLAPTSGLSFTLPDNLTAALNEAAAENPDSPFKIAIVSTLRESWHFDLREKFASLQIQTVMVAPTEDNAQRSNMLIAEKTPELSQELVYKSEWQSEAYDLVVVNPALHYVDGETGLKDFLQQIADTGAKRVVFSNLITNDDEFGNAHWKTQRYSGGIIPLFIPAKGSLTALMNELGYQLSDDTKAPATFDHDKKSSFGAQNPKLDNFSFVRRLNPS